MVRVTFTPTLQRHIACPPVEVPAGTVREALEKAFAGNDRARAYVLDDQAARIKDRVHLSDRVLENGEIYVLQALSGG
jgi:hypothetical protein